MTEVARDALLSGDGVYRYWLSRTWPDWEPDGRHTLLWVMLNPSVADAEIDDPTICRVMKRTREWGYRRAVVGNLYGLRSTNPSNLAVHPHPIGPDTDRWLRHWGARAVAVVCAWGARAEPVRAAEVIELLTPYAPLFHLGLTRSGQPRHPLYLPRTAGMQVFTERTIP